MNAGYESVGVACCGDSVTQMGDSMVLVSQSMSTTSMPSADLPNRIMITIDCCGPRRRTIPFSSTYPLTSSHMLRSSGLAGDGPPGIGLLVFHCILYADHITVHIS